MLPVSRQGPAHKPHTQPISPSVRPVEVCVCEGILGRVKIWSAGKLGIAVPNQMWPSGQSRVPRSPLHSPLMRGCGCWQGGVGTIPSTVPSPCQSQNYVCGATPEFPASGMGCGRGAQLYAGVVFIFLSFCSVLLLFCNDVYNLPQPLSFIKISPLPTTTLFLPDPEPSGLLGDA